MCVYQSSLKLGILTLSIHLQDYLCTTPDAQPKKAQVIKDTINGSEILHRFIGSLSNKICRVSYIPKVLGRIFFYHLSVEKTFINQPAKKLKPNETPELCTAWPMHRSRRRAPSGLPEQAKPHKKTPAESETSKNMS